jgi:Leucine-rich repeat (LRR) protein
MDSILDLSMRNLETWEQASQHTPEGVECVNYACNRLCDPIPTAKFTGLRYLCLCRNGITCINGWTFPETLEELNMEDNAISSLIGVTIPPRLQCLRMAINRIDSLDDVVFPRSMKYLGLDRNSIRSLRGYTFPPNITFLFLGRNSICDVAGCVFPANTTLISLERNQITDIHDCHFPSVVYKLNLTNNQIRSIRECDLGRVSRLFLPGNCLTSWYDLGELPNTLKTLSIYNNFRFSGTDSFKNQLKKYRKARRLYHFYVAFKVARKWCAHTIVARFAQMLGVSRNSGMCMDLYYELLRARRTTKKIHT